MKNSTIFWCIVALILFIWVSIISRGRFPIAIILVSSILYFLVCFFIAWDYTEYGEANNDLIPKKYNIIYIINKLLDGKKV